MSEMPLRAPREDENYPELLTELAAYVGEVLQKRGQPAEVAAEIGFETAEHVRRNWAGHSLYLPKGQEFDLSRRDLEIYHLFNGRNVALLADRFRLTEVRIYQIIKRVRTEDMRRRQPDFFRST